jgi:hypothetical protein
LRFAATTLCALGAAGCSLGNENLDQPPNARGIIIANKTLLWRNADTIHNAGIAPPQRQAGLWRVCVRMKINGPLGPSKADRDFLIALYGVSKPPELLVADAAAVCAAQPYVPFPELDGAYETDPLLKRNGKRK